jgi:hypothetical protein
VRALRVWDTLSYTANIYNSGAEPHCSKSIRLWRAGVYIFGGPMSAMGGHFRQKGAKSGIRIYLFGAYRIGGGHTGPRGVGLFGSFLPDCPEKSWTTFLWVPLMRPSPIRYAPKRYIRMPDFAPFCQKCPPIADIGPPKMYTPALQRRILLLQYSFSKNTPHSQL